MELKLKFAQLFRAELDAPLSILHQVEDESEILSSLIKQSDALLAEEKLFLFNFLMTLTGDNIS